MTASRECNCPTPNGPCEPRTHPPCALAVRTPSAHPVRQSVHGATKRTLYASGPWKASLRACGKRSPRRGLRADAAKEQLAAAEAREAGLVVDLAAERARTDAAISAFRALAERLDVLAAARERRPWWRRLVG